jgi:hypothetical protein
MPLRRTLPGYGLRPRLLRSAGYGGGTGALTGLLSGALAGSVAFLAGADPGWALLTMLGGALGAWLRGRKTGHRLGLIIAQTIGWKQFWLGAGLVVGAGIGGFVGLLFVWAIFPVFIGLFSGARLGLAAGERIWQTGNRVGWERLWGLTGGSTAALFGAGAAWLAGVGPLGALAGHLTGLLSTGLLEQGLAEVWIAAILGALGGAWGGAVAGTLVDFFARTFRLLD